ncbi:MAG: acyl carrier protein [Stellaceae bacterium]
MPPAPISEAEIRDWCVTCLQGMIDFPAAPIGPDATFAEMGLDSATSVYFVVELEDWLGRELAPEIVGDYPTISRLARHLAGGADDGGAG